MFQPTNIKCQCYEKTKESECWSLSSNAIFIRIYKSMVNFWQFRTNNMGRIRIFGIAGILAWYNCPYLIVSASFPLEQYWNNYCKLWCVRTCFFMRRVTSAKNTISVIEKILIGFEHLWLKNWTITTWSSRSINIIRMFLRLYSPFGTPILPVMETHH